MSEQEIRDLAVRAYATDPVPPVMVMTDKALEEFARLVAAREREAVAAEVALALKVGMPHDLLLDAIRKRGEA